MAKKTTEVEVTKAMAKGYLREFLTQLGDGSIRQRDVFSAMRAVENLGPDSVTVEVPDGE